MADLQIEYYDFIDLFPWKGEFMRDFIHPDWEACKLISKHLVYRWLGA